MAYQLPLNKKSKLQNDSISNLYNIKVNNNTSDYTIEIYNLNQINNNDNVITVESIISEDDINNLKQINNNSNNNNSIDNNIENNTNDDGIENINNDDDGRENNNDDDGIDNNNNDDDGGIDNNNNSIANNIENNNDDGIEDNNNNNSIDNNIESNNNSIDNNINNNNNSNNNNKDDNNSKDNDNNDKIKPLESDISKIDVNLMSREEERIYWIDCLNIFASFHVIFVHCTVTDVFPLQIKTEYWYCLFLLNCLSRACIPLLIMINGIYFLNPYNKEITIKTIYTKYLLRIFITFIIWSLYYNIFDRLVINFYNETFEFNRSLVKDMINRIILGGNHLWYLLFIFGLFLVTPLFREVTNNKIVAWYTAIGSVIVSQLIPTICEIFEVFFGVKDQTVRTFIGSTMSYTFYGYTNYFFLGHLLGTTEIKKKNYIYGIYVIGLLGILFTVALRIGSAIVYNQETHNFQEYNHFNITMNTIGFFCFFKYTVSQWIKPFIEKPEYKSILTILSDCSFGIYLVHYSVYHFFFKIGLNSITFHPLFCAPFCTIVIYSKNKNI
ncbi:hypothetical protein BCR32DRAFT_275848 [Anaeromyces robustus]|uniref:Acyltransferase 3 domain-containing protein n=1 Tax=Anaeromyces robustus TaxID=1754192 RepID=A0A1Y1XJF7_9FUNG|nr:hypothetical protein BCR32DRAFT_275848 [Anaeromyces robustus]|eukprot:ORX85891.1 hypothetical protein BCR32DRAFT_275848 [Anaeromyces robustus]